MTKCILYTLKQVKEILPDIKEILLILNFLISKKNK